MCIWTTGILSLVASGGRWPGGEKLVPSEAAGEGTRHFVGACMAKELLAVVVMCRHDSDSGPGHREPRIDDWHLLDAGRACPAMVAVI